MSLYSFLTNNIIVNNILIALKVDAEKELSAGHWKVFTYNPEKTIQQNAGFSHKEEVEESLKIVKEKLKSTLAAYCRPKASVLDFGCGPGIYMDMLKEQYNVVGVDVSEGMLEHASRLLPAHKFYHGNFLRIPIQETFQAIYSISVLEYVPVSQITRFFEKCAALLEPGGIIFIQYPHALQKLDLYYPDRNYINYSPERITAIASRYFNVIENKQSFDGRDTCCYDKTPYPTDSKTFKNGYLLIARKK